MGATLPINTSPFDMDELAAALTALAVGKAPGLGGARPGPWKTLLHSQEGLEKLAAIVPEVLGEKNIPDEWRTARVALLFKKGGSSLPEKYQPTSLLPIGYKIIAWMLQ
eukprot:846612-Pyramimonas_sp.AAC.1